MFIECLPISVVRFHFCCLKNGMPFPFGALTTVMARMCRTTVRVWSVITGTALIIRFMPIARYFIIISWNKPTRA